MKILGREPALLINAIFGALTLLAAFHLHMSRDTATAWQLLLTAIATAVTALHVRPIAPTVFTGVITAAVALGARYGWHLSEEQVAEVVAFIASAVTLVGARPQQTPVADPYPDFWART